MAPIVDALAQSESKSRFFERLGLRTDRPEDRRAYVLMKLEAAEGRRRLVESHPPDTAINETAIHREVLAIYSRACPQTKSIYDLGRDVDGIVEENWIIRWLLWHAFRYRDGRNNRNRNRQAAQSEGESEDWSRPTSASPVTVQNSATTNPPSETHDETAGGTSRFFWDPVRDV